MEVRFLALKVNFPKGFIRGYVGIKAFRPNFLFLGGVSVRSWGILWKARFF